MSKFDEAVNLIKNALGLLSQERAISIGNLYDMLFAALDIKYAESEQYVRLIDVFREEDGSLFVVMAKEGKLYQVQMTFNENGLTLGEEVPVEYEFKQVRSKPVVMRQANGKARWFLFPAATAVLNRSGELDSRQLFDSFVTHAEKTGEYPFLTIYHQDKPLEIGQADFMGRDGFSLVMSGTFNDRPIAKATARTLENDTEGVWGDSIGFYYDSSKVEKLEVAEGITVNVYNEGICREASILLEKDAASLFTGAVAISTIKEKTLMNDDLRKKLQTLVGNDPEALTELKGLEEKVDTVNQSIEAQNLVRRESKTEAGNPPCRQKGESKDDCVSRKIPAIKKEKPDVSQEQAIAMAESMCSKSCEEQEKEERNEMEPEKVTPPTPPAPAVFELDDAALLAITERVAQSELFKSVQSQVTTLLEKLEQEKTSNTELRGLVTALEGRVKTLEGDDQKRIEQAISDMPRRTLLTVVERPRERGAKPDENEGDEEGSLADVANATLASGKMK
jgi:hypothetical protein